MAEAKQSSAKIHRMFLAYLKAGDFPGADMARTFLQMGRTRARRYANHKGGRKYDLKTGEPLPRSEDAEKAAAAATFYERYVAARRRPAYVRLKKQHREKFEAWRAGIEPAGRLGISPLTCNQKVAYNGVKEKRS